MGYRKPAVTNVSSALGSIQKITLIKDIQLFFDVHIPDFPRLSAGAYEADE